MYKSAKFGLELTVTYLQIYIYIYIYMNTLEPFGLNGINEYERIIKKQGLKVMFDEEISDEF